MKRSRPESLIRGQKRRTQTNSTNTLQNTVQHTSVLMRDSMVITNYRYHGETKH